MPRIDEQLTIPDAELRFATARSSGPGGQNVNKVESRVTLLFDLAGSASLSEAQKRLLRRRLPGRINKLGVLRVMSQKHRTQAANRAAATERFVELLRAALRPRRPRVGTRPSAASRQRRLDDKRRRGRLKAERRTPGAEN